VLESHSRRHPGSLLDEAIVGSRRSCAGSESYSSVGTENKAVECSSVESNIVDFHNEVVAGRISIAKWILSKRSSPDSCQGYQISLWTNYLKPMSIGYTVFEQWRSTVSLEEDQNRMPFLERICARTEACCKLTIMPTYSIDFQYLFLKVHTHFV
jgi:hypothetical protein